MTVKQMQSHAEKQTEPIVEELDEAAQREQRRTKWLYLEAYRQGVLLNKRLSKRVKHMMLHSKLGEYWDLWGAMDKGELVECIKQMTGMRINDISSKERAIRCLMLEYVERHFI